MSNGAWHASENLLDRFVTDPGAVESAAAASLEAHLLACEHCRGAVSERVGAPTLDDSWHRVEQLVDRPRLSAAERLLTSVGVGESTARLLAATSAMSLASIGTMVMLAAALVAGGRVSDTTGGFLVLAPLFPLLAVAGAFAWIADPGGEAAAATPMQGIGLVLRRAAVILGTTFVVLGVADLAVGDLDAPVIAWLLPALALPVGALALGTWLRPEVAVGALGASWMSVVVASRWTTGPHRGYADTAMFGSPGQVVALLVLLLGGGVLVARRDRFQLVEGLR